MKMKKTLALLLAVCMMVTLLAGCAGGDDVATNPTPDANPTQSAEDGPTKQPGEGNATAGDVALYQPTGAATGTFKISGIGPLTGPYAIYGQAAMNGMQIAVDEINALGAVQFEVLTPQDDEGDGEKAINAYNKLIDDGMQVLVGTVTSGACISVASAANEDRMFMLTPSASSADVTAGVDNVFQVCFTDPNQGLLSADYIAEHMSGQKVAVIYRNDDPYSQGIRDTFANEAKAKSVDVVYEGTFTEATQTDFSAQLTAAQSAGAEVLFLPIYYQPASVILSQAKQMGYGPTFFGVDGMDGILTLENFDTSLAEDVMLLTPFAADAPDPATQSFVSKYVAQFGETPNQFAADGYDAVYILAAALDKAGCSGDMSYADICEALIGAITTIEVDGVTGASMTWAATGEVSKAPTAVVIKGGVYVSP